MSKWFDFFFQNKQFFRKSWFSIAFKPFFSISPVVSVIILVFSSFSIIQLCGKMRDYFLIVQMYITQKCYEPSFDSVQEMNDIVDYANGKIKFLPT